VALVAPIVITIMEKYKLTGYCFECDKHFIINEDGTAQHVKDDGIEIDYDEDEDHVPYQIGR
jgi:hypothetical protein